MSISAELGRRNVIRIAGLHLVGAWLMVQVAEAVLPIFGTPAWLLQAVVLLLALGFVPALVVEFGFVDWREKGWPQGCRALGAEDFVCGIDIAGAH